MISLDRQLRELNDFDGRGCYILTVYLHTDPLVITPDEIEGQVEGLVASLSAGLEPAARDALGAELSAVRDYLTSMIAPPAGIAIFSCTRASFFRIVRLPVEVAPAAYWARWAHVIPLLDAGDRAELEANALPSSPAL
jgi:hypothetical protein